MSKYGWILLITPAVMAGCVMSQRAHEAPAPTSPVSAAARSQECSNLRADIASARYRQRSQPPTSNAPVIADAANAKTEQGIDAMSQRYESLGCAKATVADTSTIPP
jgi:hypothetical protein